MTGYEPLNTLKPVARDIWVIDGPAIRFYGMAFSTRATVVRLSSGELWVHSPTKLSGALKTEISDLGPVAHLVAPNWIHYAYVSEWQSAFPGAVSWAAPGVAKRAASRGMSVVFDHDLGPVAETSWEGQIEQLIVEGSTIHREVVFFHIASKTLILTDLIENFEPAKLTCWMRPIVRLAGIADPDGQMPRDMRATFRRQRGQLREAVEQMIRWAPDRIILAHGRWYETGGVAELRRAYRFVL